MSDWSMSRWFDEQESEKTNHAQGQSPASVHHPAVADDIFASSQSAAWSMSDWMSGGTGFAPTRNAAYDERGNELPVSSQEESLVRARNQNTETSLLEDIGEGLIEGAKGAGRAAKEIGKGFVGLGSSAVRLAGTPLRMLGYDGLHRFADSIDAGYANWGADALRSVYGDTPDDWGFALGRAGEKVAGVAGSLGALGAAGKALGAAGAALKGAGYAKSAAVAANILPAMFGNDAAVRTYDAAIHAAEERGEQPNRAGALGLAAVNGAIHFFGFKAFEAQSLNKMLKMPENIESAMPKFLKAAQHEGSTFTALVDGVRNGMVKHIVAERAKGALKAGGIMGVQNFLSSIPTQLAEDGSVDFAKSLGEAWGGVGEGALMEGLMGGAAILRSRKAAADFIADCFYRDGYVIRDAQGRKVADVPPLTKTPEGRQFLIRQNRE